MAETTKKEPRADTATDQAAAAEAEAAAKAAAEADEAKATKETAKPATGTRGRGKAKVRMETFDVVRPDGKTVTVVRNIETGEQTTTVNK